MEFYYLHTFLLKFILCCSPAVVQMDLHEIGMVTGWKQIKFISIKSQMELIRNHQTLEVLRL